MSETVDRIINDQLNQRPGARHAYDHDPTMHHDIERARSMLAVVEAAMQREGIPYDSAERVLNEVVSAGLDGWEQDKRSRERMLLLADMDPSPLIERMRRESESEALWEMNRAELDRVAETLTDIPSAGPVRPDEKPAT
jgi:hypothetical protein